MVIILFPGFSTLITEPSVVSQHFFGAFLPSTQMCETHIRVWETRVEIPNVLCDPAGVSSCRFCYSLEIWDEGHKAEHLDVFLTQPC